MNQYNEDFKLRIVQIKKAGKSVSEFCNEFDLNSQSVYAVKVINSSKLNMI